jgi:hypothetical protein
MNNLEKLDFLRQKYYQDTIKEFEKQLKVFNEGTLLLMDASDILVDTVEAPDIHTSEGASKIAAWRFLSTLPTSLFWCCDIALKGDYGISKNILRLCLEELVKLAYYVAFPNRALRQVVHEKDSDETDLGEMLMQLDFDKRQDIMKSYGDLSSFYSHANLNLPPEMVYDEPKKGIQIGGGPRYRPDLFEPIIQQLIIFIANSIKVIVIRFPHLLEDKAWKNRFEEFVLKAVDVLPD